MKCLRRAPRFYNSRRRCALLLGVAAAAAAAALANPRGCLAGDKPVPVYTLSQCVDLAAQQNPDVLAAAKRLDLVRATVTTARAGIFPSVTSYGYYQRREQSLASEGGDQQGIRPNDYVADARIAQNLYSAGAVRNRIAAAEIATDAGSLDYQAQIDTTTLATRLAFYQTVYYEGTIGVQRQAIDLLAAQVKDQQDKLAAGSVGQLNVNRAQVSLVNQKPALIEAQASVRTSYVALSQLLAVAYPADADTLPFRIRGALDCPAMKMNLAECLERALGTRPEILSRKLALDVLKHQLVVEKSATRPQLSAFASYDLYSEPDVLSARDNFSGYTLGVIANWTIFDGFATRGRVRGVQAQQGEAQARLSATRQQVEADVRTAFYDLQQAAATLRPVGDNIRLAGETLDLTTRNFDAGLTTQLDVLQSRVDLTRTRLTELSGRLAYASALARLERAMAMGRPQQGNLTKIATPSK